MIPALYWLNASVWLVVCLYYLNRLRHVRSHGIRPLQRAFLGITLIVSLNVFYYAILNSARVNGATQGLYHILSQPMLIALTDVLFMGAGAVILFFQARRLHQLDQEMALSGLHAKYRYMIEADLRAILLFQLDGTLTEINRMGCYWLKGTPEEMAGFSMLKALKRLQPENTEELLARIMNKEMIELKINDRILSDFEYTELADEKGQLVGTVLCFRDITEEKKFQREIIQSEKLAVVGQLAAATAHEIRNPLTSIKGFLQLLEHRTKGYPHENEIREYTRIMVEEVDRMEKIIRDFLLMTKPSDVTRELTDLNSVIERMLVLVQNQAILRNITVETKLVQLPEVQMHREAIQQVILNLLQNAMEAMNIGGTLKIRTHVEDNYVAVEVIDTGIGMTEEEIANLGSPFYSTKTEGTGLGLTVSTKIIREHRGNMEVESEKGKGTRITVRLPR